MESERATWPIHLAVNRIHHPGEPDGIGLALGCSLAAKRLKILSRILTAPQPRWILSGCPETGTDPPK
jgi:hypothetical protein